MNKLKISLCSKSTPTHESISVRYILALNQYARLVRLRIAAYEMFPLIAYSKIQQIEIQRITEMVNIKIKISHINFD